MSDVELGVEAFFVVSKSMPKLPLQVVDAARSAAEIEEAEKKVTIAIKVQLIQFNSIKLINRGL